MWHPKSMWSQCAVFMAQSSMSLLQPLGYKNIQKSVSISTSLLTLHFIALFKFDLDLICKSTRFIAILMSELPSILREAYCFHTFLHICFMACILQIFRPKWPLIFWSVTSKVKLFYCLTPKFVKCKYMCMYNLYFFIVDYTSPIYDHKVLSTCKVYNTIYYNMFHSNTAIKNNEIHQQEVP